jgi:Flp pilus assembly protein TadD
MNEALRLRPGFPELHRRLAAAFLAMGKVDSAIANFREALRLDPKDPLTHYNLAIALELQGDLSGARDELREALRLDPENAEAHNNLGKLHASEGRLVDAITAFRRALECDERLPEAHYNLARALQTTGDNGGAMVHLRRAVTLNDRYIEASNNLAWILATDATQSVSKAQEALTYARRAAELTNHRDPGVLDTLATAYAAAGRFKEAVATGTEAAKLAEDRNLPAAGQIRDRLNLFAQNRRYVAPSPAQTLPEPREP